MVWHGIHSDKDPLSDEDYRAKHISLALMHPCWSNGKTFCNRPDLHTKESREKAERHADARVAARKKLGIAELQRELKEDLRRMKGE